MFRKPSRYDINCLIFFYVTLDVICVSSTYLSFCKVVKFKTWNQMTGSVIWIQVLTYNSIYYI